MNQPPPGKVCKFCGENPCQSGPQCPVRDEDYPGQKDEIRRERLIKMAVEAGDRILMQGSDGSAEELEYMTAAVAKAWTEKCFGSTMSRLLSRDIQERQRKL